MLIGTGSKRYRKWYTRAVVRVPRSALKPVVGRLCWAYRLADAEQSPLSCLPKDQSVATLDLHPALRFPESGFQSGAPMMRILLADDEHDSRHACAPRKGSQRVGASTGMAPVGPCSKTYELSCYAALTIAALRVSFVKT